MGSFPVRTFLDSSLAYFRRASISCLTPRSVRAALEKKRHARFWDLKSSRLPTRARATLERPRAVPADVLFAYLGVKRREKFAWTGQHDHGPPPPPPRPPPPWPLYAGLKLGAGSGKILTSNQDPTAGPTKRLGLRLRELRAARRGHQRVPLTTDSAKVSKVSGR